MVSGDTHGLCESEVEARHVLQLVLREDFLSPFAACPTYHVDGKLCYESTLEESVTLVHSVSLKYRVRTDVLALKVWHEDMHHCILEHGHEIFCAKVPGLGKGLLRICGSIDVIVEKPGKEDAERFVADVEVVVIFRTSFSQRVRHSCQEGPLNLIRMGTGSLQENRDRFGVRPKPTEDMLVTARYSNKDAHTQ